MKKRLEEVIAQKIEGREVSFVPAAEPEAQIIDLMEALRARLAPGLQAGRKGPRHATKEKAKASGRKASGRGRAGKP